MEQPVLFEIVKLPSRNNNTGQQDFGKLRLITAGAGDKKYNFKFSNLANACPSLSVGDIVSAVVATPERLEVSQIMLHTLNPKLENERIEKMIPKNVFDFWLNFKESTGRTTGIVTNAPNEKFGFVRSFHGEMYHYSGNEVIGKQLLKQGDRISFEVLLNPNKKKPDDHNRATRILLIGGKEPDLVLATDVPGKVVAPNKFCEYSLEKIPFENQDMAVSIVKNQSPPLPDDFFDTKAKRLLKANYLEMKKDPTKHSVKSRTTSVLLGNEDIVRFSIFVDKVTATRFATNVVVVESKNPTYYGIVANLKNVFGFITSGSAYGRIFFHLDESCAPNVNRQAITPGVLVEFQLERKSGKEVAVNMKVVPAAPPFDLDIASFSSQKIVGFVSKSVDVGAVKRYKTNDHLKAVELAATQHESLFSVIISTKEVVVSDGEPTNNASSPPVDLPTISSSSSPPIPNNSNSVAKKSSLDWRRETDLFRQIRNGIDQKLPVFVLTGPFDSLEISSIKKEAGKNKLVIKQGGNGDENVYFAKSHDVLKEHHPDLYEKKNLKPPSPPSLSSPAEESDQAQEEALADNTNLVEDVATNNSYNKGNISVIFYKWQIGVFGENKVEEELQKIGIPLSLLGDDSNGKVTTGGGGLLKFKAANEAAPYWSEMEKAALSNFLYYYYCEEEENGRVIVFVKNPDLITASNFKSAKALNFLYLFNSFLMESESENVYFPMEGDVVEFTPKMNAATKKLRALDVKLLNSSPLRVNGVVEEANNNNKAGGGSFYLRPNLEGGLSVKFDPVNDVSYFGPLSRGSLQVGDSVDFFLSTDRKKASKIRFLAHDSKNTIALLRHASNTQAPKINKSLILLKEPSAIITSSVTFVTAAGPTENEAEDGFTSERWLFTKNNVFNVNAKEFVPSSSVVVNEVE